MIVLTKQCRENPATRNRTRDHLITARVYSQMLYQLSYSRLAYHGLRVNRLAWQRRCLHGYALMSDCNVPFFWILHALLRTRQME